MSLHHPIMTHFFHLHLLLLLLFISTAKGDSKISFSVNVIHRNSLYKPSPSASTNSISSTVIPNNANHLMQFYIGTPPVQVHAIIDTGSDLIWSRCAPCADCYGRQVPFFDPKHSSTYKNLPCNSPLCNFLDPSSCSKGPTCQYTYGYGDTSFTHGVLATETLSFDSTDGRSVSFPSIGFGCGHNNSNSFDDRIIGIVGFGRGKPSLITQLGPSIGWRFSYCLVPFQESSSTSVMNFGDKAIISSGNVVSTPLVSNQNDGSYFITLKKISVGNFMIDATATGRGNIFIDSGTTVTLLNTKVFNELADAVSDIMKLPRTTDPGKTFACYHATSRDGFPTITFHFAGGADLLLHPLNTFTVPSDDGLTCLSMQATDGTAIFGNLAQQNFHVSYDLKGEKVSFAPTDCSKVTK